MSKIKEKTYAVAFAESVLKAKRGEEKKITDNFLKFLAANNDLKKAEKIIFIAEDIIAKKTGAKKIIAETARKININPVVKSLVKTGDKILEKINPELIAGIKITINGEKQLDFSLSRKLDNIF